MKIKSCECHRTHGTAWNPSLGHCPLGLARSLDLRWMKNVVGVGVETDDQTVCCNAQRTSVKRKQLIEASIWERTLGNYRLLSARTAAESATVDVAVFSSGSCTLGFYF